MTVKELALALSQYPEDALVFLESGPDGDDIYEQNEPSSFEMGWTTEDASGVMGNDMVELMKRLGIGGLDKLKPCLVIS